ncbi:zinc-ribbon domain-containing protein [Oceanomicrobium pacificus]|uniref:Zinc finger/thioredoxin putative domain-containing protein n=1 Tax=Oceanomicrobium pacificus TaxID=2692916 RepID=A0A6B0TQB2_9RHOB|nr:zinc-ribbon domain-containing protein [Oceanomicrobium pacificus]MXU63985.1 hypothetical protein [Oceanomicrobium pacificus]
MRIICPSCSAQYEVDDNAIPEEGREVQCGTCSTTWFQDKRSAEAPMPLGDPIGGQAAPPAAQEPAAEPEYTPPNYFDKVSDGAGDTPQAPAEPAPEMGADRVTGDSPASRTASEPDRSTDFSFEEEEGATAPPTAPPAPSDAELAAARAASAAAVAAPRAEEPAQPAAADPGPPPASVEPPRADPAPSPAAPAPVEPAETAQAAAPQAAAPAPAAAEDDDLMAKLRNELSAAEPADDAANSHPSTGRRATVAEAASRSGVISKDDEAELARAKGDLPDANDLSASLREEREFEDLSAPVVKKKSSFWPGAMTALLLFLVALGIYVARAPIAEAVPEAAPYLQGYEAGVDNARVIVIQLYEGVTDFATDEGDAPAE